jgi:hypothetical protein
MIMIQLKVGAKRHSKLENYALATRHKKRWTSLAVAWSIVQNVVIFVPATISNLLKII